VAAKCVDDPRLADDLRRAAHRQAFFAPAYNIKEIK
jgi:hypothetical protein